MTAHARSFLLIAWFDLSMVLMAYDFGAVVAAGGSPITPDQYGAAIYQIPALVWAGLQIGGGVLGLIGALMVAGEGRFIRSGAFICGLGNVCLSSMFLTFAVLSRDAEKGLLLHSLSKFPGVMVAGGCAVLAWRFLIWGEENDPVG